MKEHIEHQVIKKNGTPLFVIVPYDEYLQFRKPEKKVYFPHEVVEKSVVEAGQSHVEIYEFKIFRRYL
mgnify:CR=1 FL=1